MPAKPALFAGPTRFRPFSLDSASDSCYGYAQAVMDISVLKNGETLGPFQEQEILDKVESGELSEEDLAMTEGLEEWTPLRLIIVREAAAGTLQAEVDHWKRLAAPLPEQLKALFVQRPLGTGIVALLLGCILILLSVWPVLIFGPFVAAAIGAGVFLMGRQRLLSGIVLMTAAIILPATLCVAFFHRR